MSNTQSITRVKKTKRAGVRCDFKPASGRRNVRRATPDQAKAASEWSNEKYSATFKILAQ